MLTVTIGVLIGGAVAAAAWWFYKHTKEALQQDQLAYKRQQQVIETFRAILAERLKEHRPTITIWIAKGDWYLQPHAIIRAGGHTYRTRAVGRMFHPRLGVDTVLMHHYADEAVAFFDKKQLMKWIPND